jgi:hypothetical protein
MVGGFFKFLFYIVFFVASLIYFIPKVSLYYLLEKELKPMGVVVSSEELNDKGFSLEIKDASLNVKSIESANVSEVGITLLGIYNDIDVKDIKLTSAASSFLPINIESVNINHNIFNPLFVLADAKGEFGSVKASFDILQRRLFVILTPSKVMKNKYRTTLKNLKKTKEGVYTYEQNL